MRLSNRNGAVDSSSLAKSAPNQLLLNPRGQQGQLHGQRQFVIINYCRVVLVLDLTFHWEHGAGQDPGLAMSSLTTLLPLPIVSALGSSSIDPKNPASPSPDGMENAASGFLPPHPVHTFLLP
jgi:hypothetical protein